MGESEWFAALSPYEAKTVRARCEKCNLEDAFRAYDSAWEGVHAAVDDLVEASRRRALDKIGVERVLDDLLLLDLLGGGSE